MELGPREPATDGQRPVERLFAGWDRPIIDAAAAWLIESADGRAGAAGAVIDLRRTVVVVPGRRSGRLLDRGILELAGDRPILPPRIVTPGVLAQLVRDLGGLPPLPSLTERLLVWLDALAAARPTDRAFVLGPRSLEPAIDAAGRSGDSPVGEHLAAARRLDRLVTDLAAAGRTPADVPVHLEAEGLTDEADAWNAVARIDGWRRDRLTAAGLGDPGGADLLEVSIDARTPDTGTADAVETLLLVAIPELSSTATHAVDWLAAGGAAVHALIRGEEDDRDLFDRLGQPIPARWSGQPVAPSDAELVIAERPADVTDVVVDLLAEHAADQPADDVVIGLADPQLAPLLRLSAQAAGIHVHDAAGVPLASRPAVRLLQLVGRWVRDRESETLAELVRLPRFEAIVARRVQADGGDAARDLPADVDRWLRRTFTRVVVDDTSMAGDVPSAVAALDDLVRGLRGPARPVSEWGPEFGRLLAGANADRDVVPPPFDPVNIEPTDDESDWLRLAALAEELTATSPDFGTPIDGPAALEMFLHLAADERRPWRPVREAIDMLGWLELPTDPAPVMMLCGVHDRAIPGRAAADPLLPDRLRSQLGLADDAARMGRDAWVLSAALRGRRVSRVVAGRLDAEGGAHIPSRLLLKVDSERLPARLRALVSQEAVRAPSPPPAGGRGDAFGRPSVTTLLGPDAGDAGGGGPALMNSMRVTDFAAYLRCGYRFLLERGLQLRAPEDDPRELDPRAFGTLMHDALARFATDAESRDLTDESAIRRGLRRHLERAVAARFGSRPWPAVRVQIERAGRRLDAFAGMQAELRTSGWRTVAAEIPLRGAAITGPDMSPMPVRGTIDRIDRHADGAWRIIDYKTSDKAAEPREKHLVGGRRAKSLEWRDLQLPLYRRLARGRTFPGDVDDADRWFDADSATVEGQVDVGYIVLPATAGDTEWRPANFTTDEIDHAMERARQIVAEIRAGAFAVASPGAIATEFDDWAWICHAAVDVFGGAGSEPADGTDGTDGTDGADGGVGAGAGA